MPRPERYKKREGAIAPPAEAAAASVDDAAAIGQDARTGLIPADEEAIAERVAKRLGWKSREEWGDRAPANWMPASQFLERTPTEIENLKDRLKRTGQAAETAIEDARKRAVQEAEIALRAAAKTGNEEAAVAAARVVAENSGPDPRVTAWIAARPWFNQDVIARRLAIAVCDDGARAGKSVEDQLDAAEAEVRRRFPEHYPQSPAPAVDSREEPQETRMSQMRTPPVVAPGQRGSAPPVSRQTGPGWNDIPAADRQSLSKFVRKMATHNVSEADAQKRLAASYWSNKEQR